ncbi:lipoprotein, putative [Citrifermentans bemidjiense Bem]|uniref:Lipoprotein, putative n=1 Tax=Citrifermentans bemidjiense (strain ATCC BAA-1014 / DSM 16622 / JCM 12645 / Bem) TaxID=404380 RepID=B5E8F7_CITBB|nr:DUF2155 domain-containing protein [Citrifermentans bemidjiense]ACH37140.1 lipoprotein, putative [Citrifermentans bemidjiense Bem]
MKRLMKLLVLSSLVAIGFTTGCNEKQKQEQAAVKPQPAKPPTEVVVPDDVKRKWKAVEIAVSDKQHNQQKVYTIKLGSELKIPGSNLTLRVENFLPHFVMEGTTLTSQSNQLVNPAAQIVIREDAKEIYKGWLFSLYPTTHAFQHPLYGFTLVDYLPAS